MPCFACSNCKAVENTALSLYWTRRDKPALCSECDPQIGKWHDSFEKRSAIGYLIGNDGFLYSQQEMDSGYHDWRIKNNDFKIVGKVE